jgi:uncharacterized membrane protein YhaH (DUF805 family)
MRLCDDAAWKGAIMEWMLLPLKRYADFNGRSRRKEYWMFALFLMALYLVAGSLLLAGGLIGAIQNDTMPEFSPLFWLGIGAISLLFLATFIPSLAVTVRRFHDRDMSGWWYLAFVVGGNIPFVGPLVSLGFLVLMCLEGTRGPNRFGPDPKDPNSVDVFA